MIQNNARNELSGIRGLPLARPGQAVQIRHIVTAAQEPHTCQPGSGLSFRAAPPT
jgi:hypothetical protein